MSMKLAILGMLMEGDRHPYEMLQTMKERSMHHYIKIQDGSLYYAIDRLLKDGYVTVIDVIKDSNRPDKTIYRITESGKMLFQQLLIDSFMERAPFFKPINAALAFAHHGDERRIAEALAAAIAETERRVERLRDVYEEHIPTVPRSSLYIMRGFYEHAMLELDWMRRLHKDAEAGRLGEIGKRLDE